MWANISMKWWFHLYSIINEQNGGEDEKADKKILDEILEKYAPKAFFYTDSR